MAPGTTEAQAEDFNWFVSSTEVDLNQHGLTFFQFNKSDSVQKYNPEIHVDLIRDGAAKASISDPEGNLLFFSDGYDVFNKNFDLMENGDKLAYSGIIKEFYELVGTLLIPNRMVILPYPDSDFEYYLIYNSLIRDFQNDPNIARSFGLYYSKVDLSKNDGLGQVTQKNQPLLQDNFACRSLLPIRHANGRDWWILQKHWDEPRWFVFLLDPDGIHLSHETEVGGFPNFVARFAEVSTMGDRIVYLTSDHFYPWIPSSQIDPDDYDYQFHFFNFDRCSGQIDFEKSISQSLIPSSAGKLNWFTVEWNSQNLYFSRGNYMKKLNIGPTEAEITHDTILTKEQLDLPAAHNGFHFPRITPEGELWITHWSSDKVTVFRNPELGTGEENWDPEPIKIFGNSGGNFPHFPNFRLGPIDGGPCDTSGVDNVPAAWFRYNGMNLDDTERRFTDLSYFEPENWLWDFDDGSIHHGREAGVHEFPGPGEYHVCLTVWNEFGEDTFCRWVTIDDISSTENISNSDTWIRLYSNPARDFTTLRWNGLDPVEVGLYDITGRQILHDYLQPGQEEYSLQLENLAAGVYIVHLKSLNGVIMTEQLVVVK